MEALTPLLSAAGAEALKAWGVFATVIILLGWIIWVLRKALAAERADNKALHAEIKALQERRVEDARELIRVTNASTATVAARGDGEQRVATILQGIVDKISDIEASQSRTNDNRQLLEQLVAMATTKPNSRAPRQAAPPKTAGRQVNR